MRKVININFFQFEIKLNYQNIYSCRVLLYINLSIPKQSKSRALCSITQ